VLPEDRDGCGCGEALKLGIITPREAVPQRLVDRLKPLIGKYFE
jgi:hypothetical protein